MLTLCHTVLSYSDVREYINNCLEFQLMESKMCLWVKMTFELLVIPEFSSSYDYLNFVFMMKDTSLDHNKWYTPISQSIKTLTGKVNDTDYHIEID